MIPVTIGVGPLTAASANAICLSQTPAGAGLLNLNGALVANGVATLPQTRRIRITMSGDETTRTFTVTGTTYNGVQVTETIAGKNNTSADSVLDYATVTSISISSAAAAPLTVGTSPVAGSTWVRMDDWAPLNVALQVKVSGTANYTIQQTMDDPNSATHPVALQSVAWLNSSDANVVAASSTQQSYYAFVPVFVRAVLNSGTGSISATIRQSGVNPA